MSTGRNYGRITDPQLSDLAYMWDSSASAYVFSAYTYILDLMQNNLVFPDAGRPEPNTQYAAPGATGFDVAITDNNEDTHLILTPGGAYADGAITLPASTSVRDKQIVIVNCTQAVTAFVVNGNGASAVNGAPTTLAANDFFTLKYDLTLNSWYRIG